MMKNWTIYADMHTHPKSKIGHAQGFTKIRKHSKLRNSILEKWERDSWNVKTQPTTKQINVQN